MALEAKSLTDSGITEFTDILPTDRSFLERAGTPGFIQNGNVLDGLDTTGTLTAIVAGTALGISPQKTAVLDLTGQSSVSLDTLPAGIERFRLTIANASNSAEAAFLVRVRTATGDVATGYTTYAQGLSQEFESPNAVSTFNIAAASFYSGHIEFSKVPDLNQWIASHGSVRQSMGSTWVDAGAAITGFTVLPSTGTFDNGVVWAEY